MSAEPGANILPLWNWTVRPIVVVSTFASSPELGVTGASTSLRDKVSTMPRVTRSYFSVLGSETENMMTKNAINNVMASA